MIRTVSFAAASVLAAAAMAQGVDPTPPNAPSQKPAFAGQTRAPALPKSAVTVETVATGIAKPWAIEVMADGRMLVTEKAGALRIVGRDGKLSAPLSGVPAVDARGQGGLLDVALLPASRICLSFSEPRGEGTNGTSVACGTLDVAGNAVRDLRVIWRMTPAWASRGHYGSRIVPARDGTLFVTTGERQLPEPRQLAQKLDAAMGKVIRINADGSAPKDNPFVGTKGALPEIWSYGHRNLQSAALDAQGRLWTVEHGPKGGDELNRPQPGKNYGWPIITYGIDYNGQPIGEGITAKAGMEQPIYYWDPSFGPSGMVIYGDRALAAWRGDALIGGLASKDLVRVKLKGDRVIGEERIPVGARIRDVTVGPDGFVYLVTDEDNGRILRVRPARS